MSLFLPLPLPLPLLLLLPPLSGTAIRLPISCSPLSRPNSASCSSFCCCSFSNRPQSEGIEVGHERHARLEAEHRLQESLHAAEQHRKGAPPLPSAACPVARTVRTLSKGQALFPCQNLATPAAGKANAEAAMKSAIKEWSSSLVEHEKLMEGVHAVAERQLKQQRKQLAAQHERALRSAVAEAQRQTEARCEAAFERSREVEENERIRAQLQQHELQVDTARRNRPLPSRPPTCCARCCA